MENIESLKEKFSNYFDDWEKNGGKIGYYACPACEKSLKTTLPDDEGVVWDSIVNCYECGFFHWTAKTIFEIHVCYINNFTYKSKLTLIEDK